jgi:hypothetical protein
MEQHGRMSEKQCEVKAARRKGALTTKVHLCDARKGKGNLY